MTRLSLESNQKEQVYEKIRNILAISPNKNQVEVLEQALRELGINHIPNSVTASLYIRKATGIFSSGKKRKAVLSPMEKIRNAEQEINAAIRELDDERNLLQQKIIELDNTAAKYRTNSYPRR